jgi:hypothetical protein
MTLARCVFGRTEARTSTLDHHILQSRLGRVVDELRDLSRRIQLHPELSFALQLEQGLARGVLQEGVELLGFLLAFELAERPESPPSLCRKACNLLLDHLDGAAWPRHRP